MANATKKSSLATSQNPLLYLHSKGQATLEPFFMQKPICSTLVQVAGLDENNKDKKLYFAIVASDKQSGKGSLFLIRQRKNLKSKHHLTLFRLDSSVTARLNQTHDGAEIELSFGRGTHFIATSVATSESYQVDGKLVLCSARQFDEQSVLSVEGSSRNLEGLMKNMDINKKTDDSLNGLLNALLQIGVISLSRFKGESGVSEENLMGEVKNLISQIGAGIEKKNVDEGKLRNTLRLVEETVFTEIKYLCAYDWFQVAFNQLEVLLMTNNTSDLSNFERPMRDITRNLDAAASKASDTLQAIHRAVFDISLIADDEAAQVVSLSKIVTESARAMRDEERELLMCGSRRMGLLDEMKTNALARQFLESLESSSDSRKLLDLLVFAMQRLTRRNLLFASLCENLQTLGCFSVRQQREIEGMRDMMKSIAVESDEYMARSALQMDTVTNELKKVFAVNEPGRECLYRAQVANLTSLNLGLDKVPQVMFVFNDCVLLAKKSGSTSTLEFQNVFKLKSDTFEFGKMTVDGLTVSVLTIYKSSDGKKEELELGKDAAEVQEIVNKAVEIAQDPSFPELRLPHRDQKLSARVGRAIRGFASPSRSGSMPNRSTPSSSSTPLRPASPSLSSMTSSSFRGRADSGVTAPMRPGSPMSRSMNGGGAQNMPPNVMPSAQQLDGKKLAATTPARPTTPGRSASTLKIFSGMSASRASPRSAVRAPPTANGGAARFMSESTPQRPGSFRMSAHD